MPKALTNSQLGKLALNAAITIERIQNRLPTENDQVDRFLNALTDEIDESSELSALRDETMYPFYSIALAKSTSDERPARNQFSGALKEALARHKSSAMEGDELEKVKRFCLAFHEAIVRASQRNSTTSPRFDGRL